jgi:hypothetical protein
MINFEAFWVDHRALLRPLVVAIVAFNVLLFTYGAVEPNYPRWLDWIAITELVIYGLGCFIVSAFGYRPPERPPAAAPVPAPAPVIPPVDQSDARILGEVLRYLGEYGKPKPEEVAFYFTEEDLRRHSYFPGRSGAGKTTVLERMGMADIAAGRSVIFMAEKVDGINGIATRLAAQPETWSRVTLLEASSATTGLNPLVGPGEAYIRAQRTFEIIAHHVDVDGVQVSHTLRMLLLALAEVGGTLADVEPILYDAEVRQRLVEQVTNQAVLQFFAQYEALPEPQKNLWRLPISNKLGPFLAIPPIRQILTNPDLLPLKDLIDTPGSILLVSLDADKLGQGANLIGGLFIATLTNFLWDRSRIKKEERNPLTLFLDEFQRFAADSFDPLLAEGRRYGLRLRLANQSLVQLSKELRQMILSNVGALTVFQVGGKDASDLAQEIPCPSHVRRSDLRDEIMAQRVGHGLVVQAGEDVRWVRFFPAPLPNVPDRVVAEMRRQAVNRFAKSHSKRAPAADMPTTQEVRHVRRPA